MCVKRIKAFFKKDKQVLEVTTTPKPKPDRTSPPAPTALPYPEEPPDYTRTMENTTFSEVLYAWFEKYHVPEQYREFWQSKIVATVTVDIPYPAGTWDQDGKRHLAVRPEWLNPGVIAHEQAHNSYALLTSGQKSAFSMVYNPLKNVDPLIKLLYSINRYGLTNDIEGHAEVYRYLGGSMPIQLKEFYPKLF